MLEQFTNAARKRNTRKEVTLKVGAESDTACGCFVTDGDLEPVECGSHVWTVTVRLTVERTPLDL